MATLGVVPFSGTMATSHSNRLQLLGHSESSIVNNGERREIIILRRKNNTPVVEAVKTELDCSSEAVNSISEATTTTVLVSSNQSKFTKKKPSMNLPRAHHQPPPVAVARRNARERNRVKQVNNGFATLRQHIPLSVSSNYSSDSAGSGSRASRKLSKVETLRMAVDYIRSLQQLLSMDDEGNSESCTASSTSISHTQMPSPNSTSSSSDASSPSPKHTGGISPQPSPNSISSADPRCPPSYCPSETIPNDYERTTPSVLIEDDDDDTSSFIDPTSPSSSTTLRSTSSGNFASPPQYHYRSALPRTSSLIQVMGNAIGSYAHDGTGFVPLAATTTLKDATEEYLATSHHELGRLQLHQQLATTVEDSYHPEDLVLLGARLHRSPNVPTTANSLSPGVYSEQSLSPETAIVSAEVPSSNIDVGISSSSTFLPAFSSALSRVTPRASALHLITSSASPIQYVSSSTLQSAVVAQHEAYSEPAPASIELLSQVKMEMEDANCNTEDIAGGDEVVIVEGGAGGSAEVMDVMSWWEQEQRLRLITAPNAPPSS